MKKIKHVRPIENKNEAILIVRMYKSTQYIQWEDNMSVGL